MFNPEDVIDRLEIIISDLFGESHGRIRQFSVLTGIGMTTISAYLNQKTMPGAKALAQIALACDVNINWLLIGELPKKIGGKLNLIEKCANMFPDNSDLQLFEQISHQLDSISKGKLQEVQQKMKLTINDLKEIIDRDEEVN